MKTTGLALAIIFLAVGLFVLLPSLLFPRPKDNLTPAIQLDCPESHILITLSSSRGEKIYCAELLESQ